MLARFSQWLWSSSNAPTVAPLSDAPWTDAREQYFSTVAHLASGGKVGALQYVTADAPREDVRYELQQQAHTMKPLQHAPRAAVAAAWQECNTSVLRAFMAAVRSYACTAEPVTYAQVAYSVAAMRPLPAHTYPPILLTLQSDVPVHAVDLHVRKSGMPSVTRVNVTIPATVAVSLAQTRAARFFHALVNALVEQGVSATSTTPVLMTAATRAALWRAARDRALTPEPFAVNDVHLSAVRPAENQGSPRHTREGTTPSNPEPCGAAATACGGSGDCGDAL